MKKILLLAFLLFSLVAVQADWKSWLHGSPPAATPGPPDATAARVSFAPEVSPDKPVLDFLLAFAEALRVHDGAALKPLVSEKYAIADLPAEHKAIDFLMQAIVKAKAPDEIIVTSIQTEGEVRVAKVEFRSANRPPKTRTFRFDAAGKLVGSDFFSLQRQGFGH